MVQPGSACACQASQPKRRSAPRKATSGGNHSKVASGGFKRHQGIVAAIGRRHHDPGGSEIDAEFHDPLHQRLSLDYNGRL